MDATMVRNIKPLPLKNDLAEIRGRTYRSSDSRSGNTIFKLCDEIEHLRGELHKAGFTRDRLNVVKSMVHEYSISLGNCGRNLQLAESVLKRNKLFKEYDILRQLAPTPESREASFKIDHEMSDHEYLVVDVVGRGVVIIKREEEGIVIDIYAFDNAEDPVASTWAHMDDLFSGEDVVAINRVEFSPAMHKLRGD